MRFITSPRADQTSTRDVIAEAIVDEHDSDRSLLMQTWLRPGQVAAVFQVSRRAVNAWALSGLIPSIRTPGGHHRFLASDVHALLKSRMRPFR